MPLTVEQRSRVLTIVTFNAAGAAGCELDWTEHDDGDGAVYATVEVPLGVGIGGQSARAVVLRRVAGDDGFAYFVDLEGEEPLRIR